MKTTTILFILIGLIATAAFIGLIIILKSPDTKKGEKILKKSGSLLLTVLLISFIFSDLHRDYSIYEEQNTWKKYQLPQLDSLMYLNIIETKWSNYRSLSQDSIYHSGKIIRFDLFDIYSIEDDFINKKQDKILTLKFIKPNIIRDSLRVMTLKTRSDYMNKLPIETLTFSQFDSVLTDWGLRKGLYDKLVDY
ncbi:MULTISPECIES: hypothetical protein [unclassified Saccharicrinis]|uniref:hypothetical protein n=1 Tax=unclassified Saccharicrinis TaxID=2646859 RepID=UPI0035DCD433